MQTIATSLLLVSALGVANSQPAFAATITDNIVPTGNTGTNTCIEGVLGNAYLCQSDNAALNYYATLTGTLALEAPDATVVANVITEYGNDTDLTGSYDTTPTYSGSAETDIIYEEGPVPGDVVGFTWCDDDSLGGWLCDQQYIRIEGAGEYTHGLTCHETGHAVGLTHGSEANPTKSNSNTGLDCMMNPVPVTKHLGSNSIGNINNVY